MLSLDYLSENIDEANIYKGPLADSSLERRFLPMSRRLAWLASESGLLQVPPTVFTRFSKITCKTHTTTGLGVVNTGNVRARSLLLPGRRLRAVPADNLSGNID